MTPEFSGRGDPERTLRLLWRRGERPASRGPRATLSVDAIVETAVRLADAEGLGAVSMRRIGTELGGGAMSLYRHVPGKGELLDLMLDHVNGEIPPPPAGAEGWRALIEHSARAQMASYLAHPWVLDVAMARPPLGPNVMRTWEAMMAGVAATGLPVTEWNALAQMVSASVEGVARWRVREGQAEQATGVSDDDWWASRQVFWESYFDQDAHPTITETYTRGGYEPDVVADTFELGLAMLLDGIAARIAAHEAGG